MRFWQQAQSCSPIGAPSSRGVSSALARCCSRILRGVLARLVPGSLSRSCSRFWGPC